MDRDGGGWSLAVSWSVWKAVNLSCQPRLSVCQSWLSCVVSHPWGLPEQRLTVQTYGLISVTWNSQNCYISNLKIWKPKQKKKERGRPWHLVCALPVVRFGVWRRLCCVSKSPRVTACVDRVCRLSSYRHREQRTGLSLPVSPHPHPPPPPTPTPTPSVPVLWNVTGRGSAGVRSVTLSPWSEFTLVGWLHAVLRMWRFHETWIALFGSQMSYF